jgi:hypothetical protein
VKFRRNAASTEFAPDGGTKRGAIMITRKPKPKPDYSPDRPTEQLQLVLVTIEHKLPARAAQPWLDAELWPGSLPQGKITLH